MMRGIGTRIRVGLAALSLSALAGCETADIEAFAAGMQMAADDMAVTLTQVPAYGCGWNAQHDPVCDDTGDGFADRYADPRYDWIPGYSYVSMPTRINDYGEAYEYDTYCDCWRREPSLDTYPK